MSGEVKVVECSLSSASLFGRLCQEFANEVFRVRIDRAPPRPVKGYILSANLVGQVWRFEGVFARNKVVHEDSCGPAVKWLPVSFTTSLQLMNLRRQVVWSAQKQLAFFLVA